MTFDRRALTSAVLVVLIGTYAAAPLAWQQEFTNNFRYNRGQAIQPIFEVFNLTNADNITVVNSALYGVNTTTNVLTPNASFGQPTTTAGQRIIQLAVRFTF